MAFKLTAFRLPEKKKEGADWKGSEGFTKGVNKTVSGFAKKAREWKKDKETKKRKTEEVEF